VKLWTKRPRGLALAAVAAAAAVMGSAPFVLANDGILEVILSGQRAFQPRPSAPAAFPSPIAPQVAPQPRSVAQPPRLVVRPQVAPTAAPRVVPAVQSPRIAQPPKPVLPPRARQEWAKASVALPKSEETASR
jgi:hypothetical protein